MEQAQIIDTLMGGATFTLWSRTAPLVYRTYKSRGNKTYIKHIKHNGKEVHLGSVTREGLRLNKKYQRAETPYIAHLNYNFYHLMDGRIAQGAFTFIENTSVSETVDEYYERLDEDSYLERIGYEI